MVNFRIELNTEYDKKTDPYFCVTGRSFRNIEEADEGLIAYFI
jgi:hypothetical protein